MIATFSTIFYVISLTDENKGKYTIQWGQAVSKLNDDGNFLIYNFTNWVPTSQPEATDDSLSIQLLHLKSIHQIIGKFTLSHDGSINIIITANIHLSLSEDNIPISKPIVSLVGHINAEVTLTESAFHLPLIVKPYLSADSCDPIIITLIHPSEGWLKKSFTAAKKNITNTLYRNSNNYRTYNVLPNFGVPVSRY